MCGLECGRREAEPTEGVKFINIIVCEYVEDFGNSFESWTARSYHDFDVQRVIVTHPEDSYMAVTTIQWLC